MGTLWIKRTDSSSYFPPHFQEMEKQALEGISGVQYLSATDPVPESGDLCLITNTHTRLADWKTLRNRTRFILHPNSGFDNLLPDIGEWGDVPIVLGNAIRAPAVVQWAIACVLQHTVPVVHQSCWPKSRAWERPLLQDKNVLVIGLGPVGQGIAEALRGLGCLVDTHDPFLGHTADIHANHDIVILAASLNQKSRHLLNSGFFTTASPELLLINPARGELIDERALREFLHQHPKARAYLDVHAREPFPNGYWDDCPQVIANPHIAGVWAGLTDSLIRFEGNVIERFQKGQGFPSEAFLSRRKTPQGWYR